MKTLIVFYSRTGATKALASELAARLNADVAEIFCDQYRPGWLRYLRAGYDSVKGNIPHVEVPRTTYRDYDVVLLGTPVWTSYPSLPMRAFLKSKPELPHRVGLFLTYGGHSPADKAVREIEALLLGPLEASLALNEKFTRAGQTSSEAKQAVDKFIESLVHAKDTRSEEGDA